MYIIFCLITKSLLFMSDFKQINNIDKTVIIHI